jgi:phosphocarrier protein
MSDSFPNDGRAVDPSDDPAGAAPDGVLRRELMIVNKRGLHARASAKFVMLAETFDAEITVSRAGETVGGTSIMGLMMLAAAPGTSIEITAHGAQAVEAMEALSALVIDKFGEGE